MILYNIDISNKEEVIKWLNKIRTGSGDARPLWTAMIKSKKIEQFARYEFNPSSDSHKMWADLKPNYLRWKKAHKFPTGIGFLTGKLREAASSDAKKVLKKKSLTWILNSDVPVSKRGYKYAPVFHWGKRDGSQPPRKIFRYTHLRVSSFLKLDAKKFASGVRHASFTYVWLRKVLEGK
jgi:hypothetical protein